MNFREAIQHLADGGMIEDCDGDTWELGDDTFMLNGEPTMCDLPSFAPYYKYAET